MSEDRAMNIVRGVGFGDQIAEVVPGVTAERTVTVERMALYLANIFQVFGYFSGVDGLVRSLKHHKWPFDIKQEIVFSEVVNQQWVITGSNVTAEVPASSTVVQPSASGGGILGTPNALITILEGCWINNYSVDFPNEQTPVAESVTITCTDVLDGQSLYNEFVETGNNAVSTINNQIGSQLFSSVNGV